MQRRRPDRPGRLPTLGTLLRPAERRMVALLAVVALLLVVVGGLVPLQPWIVDWRTAESPVRQVLSVTGEMSAWVWFNVVVLLAAAGAYAVTGALQRSAGRPPWPWLVLAALLAALSFDDLVAVHERLWSLGELMGGGGDVVPAAWVLPALLVAGVLVWAVWQVARRVERRSRLLLVVGTAVFLGSAFLLEDLTFRLLEPDGGGAAAALVSYTEELLEAWGAVLLLASGTSAWSVTWRPGAVDLRLRREATTGDPTAGHAQAVAADRLMPGSEP